jgi:hypothetical protein
VVLVIANEAVWVGSVSGIEHHPAMGQDGLGFA